MHSLYRASAQPGKALSRLAAQIAVTKVGIAITQEFCGVSNP